MALSLVVGLRPENALPENWANFQCKPKSGFLVEKFREYGYPLLNNFSAFWAKLPKQQSAASTD
jgi:hypothetical protein